MPERHRQQRCADDADHRADEHAALGRQRVDVLRLRVAGRQQDLQLGELAVRHPVAKGQQADGAQAVERAQDQQRLAPHGVAAQGLEELPGLHGVAVQGRQRADHEAEGQQRQHHHLQHASDVRHEHRQQGREQEGREQAAEGQWPAAEEPEGFPDPDGAAGSGRGLQ